MEPLCGDSGCDGDEFGYPVSSPISIEMRKMLIDCSIINVGWLSINCINPQQRSIAMA